MTAQMLLPMPTDTLWVEVRDGDPRALELHKRHYSHRHYKDGRADDLSNGNRWLICGPGQKAVLLHLNDDGEADALFTWVRHKSRWADGRIILECSAFRNESTLRASTMIAAARQVAAVRWPDETEYYTSVNPAKVASEVAGYCFIRDKWKRCGVTKSGLIMYKRKVKP